MFQHALGYRLISNIVVLVLTPQAAVHPNILGTVGRVCIDQAARIVLRRRKHFQPKICVTDVTPQLSNSPLSLEYFRV